MKRVIETAAMGFLFCVLYVTCGDLVLLCKVRDRSRALVGDTPPLSFSSVMCTEIT